MIIKYLLTSFSWSCYVLYCLHVLKDLINIRTKRRIKVINISRSCSTSILWWTIRFTPSLEGYSCNGYTIMQLYTNKILFQVSETENLRKNLAVERMIIEGCDILLDVNQVFVRQGRLIGCFTLFAFVCLHLFPLFFIISHLISSPQSFKSIWHSSLLSHLTGHFVLTLWMPQGSVHDRLLSTLSLSRSFRPISLSLEFW